LRQKSQYEEGLKNAKQEAKASANLPMPGATLTAWSDLLPGIVAGKMLPDLMAKNQPFSSVRPFAPFSCLLLTFFTSC
jgi:hypothetical protein